jgi:hypothetical protein
MCRNGVINTFLRSEASYSIFVFIKSGNVKRNDFIFTALKPMIYVDGMIMRVKQGVTNYDNVIGWYLNVDEDDERSKIREDIDNAVKSEMNTLIGYLYHGNGNKFIEYCGINKISILNGIDVLERISPFDRFKGNTSRDNEDDGDNVNIYKIEYFKTSNEIRGIKFNIGVSSVIRIISVEVILP